MQNFSIQNKSDVSVVEIFGDIGEGFFSEGITINSINDQLKEIKSPQIKLRVASLGGSVNHALAIHDILKMHPAKITTEIIGVTASSGTIVAMAGDEVKMSKNALFLVHNAHTMAGGDAETLRGVADSLDKHNDRIINIYQKKTGKNREDISDLMNEERFIDSSEAKKFGFITNEFEPIDAAASISEDKKTEILNKLKEFKNKEEMDFKKEIQDLKEKFEAFIGKDKPEGFEKEIKDSIAGIESNLVQVKGLQTEVKDLSEKAAGLETEKDTLTTEKAEIQDKLDTLTTENTALQTEHNKLKAEKTDLDVDKDVDLDKDKVEVTALGSGIVDLLDENQKAALKTNKKDKK